MTVTINGIEGVEVSSTTVVGRGLINVNLIGATPENILASVSINDVISYFGETELLDFIGKESIQTHVDSKLEEEN